MKSVVLVILLSMSLTSCLNFIDPDKSPLEFEEVGDILPIEDDQTDTDQDQDQIDNSDDLNPDSDVVSFSQLKAKVLEKNKCLICHAWAAEESTLLDGHRVKPGDADGSLLFILVRTGAMPKAPFPALSSEDLEIVENYIKGLKK